VKGEEYLDQLSEFCPIKDSAPLSLLEARMKDTCIQIRYGYLVSIIKERELYFLCKDKVVPVLFS
jgi:hypothetical protein